MTKAAVKAMIGYQIKMKNQILKCSENRDVKDTRKIPLTTVIIYEAPYELDDIHIYRILSKYGDIKGNITRHISIKGQILRTVIDLSYSMIYPELFQRYCG